VANSEEPLTTSVAVTVETFPEALPLLPLLLELLLPCFVSEEDEAGTDESSSPPPLLQEDIAIESPKAKSSPNLACLIFIIFS
jgi:hypothetical protein